MHNSVPCRRLMSIPPVVGIALSLLFFVRPAASAPAASPVRGGHHTHEYLDLGAHRTISIALQADREDGRVLAFTLKERLFVPPADVPLPRRHAKGETVQIEVALLGPGGSRFTRRVDVPGLCFDHDPGFPIEIEGDTFRLHRETFIVEMPEIAGFDQVEMAFYLAASQPLARRVIGVSQLDSAHFSAAGGSAQYQDLAFAERTAASPPSISLTPGTLHLPEEFGDTDIFTVYGNLGEASKRINIVIVPDGYTYAQKATMQADAQAMVDAFRDMTPYEEHDRFINYILVYAYSTEDGTDQCDCSIVRDTAMSTRFPLVTATCGHDDNRCLSYGGGCDPTDSSGNIAITELRAPAQDTTVVMVNTTRYGGCGGARAVYSAGAAAATEIAIHELGHSLAGLADEYGGDPSCGAGSGINVSTDSVNGAWPEWIADIGAPRESAKYYDMCIYRPITSCEMRTLSQEFCPVCKQQWALTYFGHPRVNPTSPIESSSPASPSYTNVGMPITYSLGTRLASGAGITNSFTWKLQGPGFPVPTTVATGVDSHTRTYSPSGTYTLTSEVIADTNFIKPPKNGPNVDTATFTTDVCDPTLACNAGGPYVVECAAGQGTIPLQGSAPTAESLRYYWTTDCQDPGFVDQTAANTQLVIDGPPPCPTTCSVTLNAVHDCSSSFICTASVTVEDTIAPTVTVPPPLSLECSAQGGVPKTDPAVVAWLAQAGATDLCSATTLTDDTPDLIPSGCGVGTTTTVTFTGEDACNLTTMEDSTITVGDTSGPVIDVQPSIAGGCAYLWPPNHGYVDFTIADTGIVAHDVCDGVTFEFSSCESSQPEDIGGGGDGHSTRDCLTDGQNLHLRAERLGGCSHRGRTYRVTVDAIDACGNRTTSLPFEIGVPHDLAHQGPGTQYSANGNQNDARPGVNGTYGTGCGAGSPCATASVLEDTVDPGVEEDQVVEE